MNSPYLCGGVFVFIINQAKIANNTYNDSRDTSDHSNPSVLRDLTFVFTGSRNYGAATKDCSEYVNCKTEGSINVPFNDQSFIDTFDSLVKDHYAEVLLRMSDFVDRHINTGKKEWLVKALLRLLAMDTTIDPGCMIYALPDGKPVSKGDLILCDRIFLEPLLSGMLHYILTNRCGKNCDGLSTLDSISEKKGNGRTYTGTLVEDFGRSITVISSDFRNTGEDDTYRDDEGNDADRVLSRLLPKSYHKIKDMPVSLLDPSDTEDSYYLKTYDKYCSLKTLLYNDQPRAFYDFFVCSNLLYRKSIRSNSFRFERILDATVEKIREVSRYVIITGTGGLGKSMMMRHLLLDTIKRRAENHLLPVFIPLKNYDPEVTDLIHFIFDLYSSADGRMSFSDFEKALASDRYVLLFDGLDEIKSAYTEAFSKELEEFVDRYSEITYIMSSRPYSSFVSFSRFTVLNLCAFSKEQSLSLIDKLEFRPDEPMIKENFKAELSERLYRSHTEFCTNPLLLTIMLMTYEQFAEIPSKMHIFYKEAYIALSQRHDAIKVGFNRAFRTGLSAEQFEQLFAEFCARSYLDEKYEFTEDEISAYYNQLSTVKNLDVRGNATDFIYDLVNNVCLLYYEGGKYSFTHRSFQEYFCALFFSRQLDRTLPSVGEIFSKMNKYGDFGSTEKTFDMLYDMIPERVEECIFLDFLENKLFSEVSGYWDYLKFQYPTIVYREGEGRSADIINAGYNFILRKICSVYGITHKAFEQLLPFYDDLTTQEYVYVDDHYSDDDWLERHYKEYGFCVEDSVDIIDKDDVSSLYLAVFGEPEHAGWDLEVSIDEILENPEYFSAMIKVLDRDSFPLKTEYSKLLKVYKDMSDMHYMKVNSSDFFEQFI